MKDLDNLTPEEERSRQALVNLREITLLLLDASVIQGGLDDLEMVVSYALTIMLDTIYAHPEALPVWVEALRADPTGPMYVPPKEDLPPGTASPEEAKLELVAMLINGLARNGGDDVER
jgi:hypothetical protein